ncbi:MAG: hypothetical protein N838_07220 [Thiohalocapsa sp. PB-PSB1]|jgi:hypothetical protein|nr:MAG: hypothetical protein N838_07220 [Thiohalocapsa sp. PB-PSB1]HCS91263.1 hypothetical protein [Chromatiaceae bacterium]
MPAQPSIAKAVLQQIGWNEDGDVSELGPEFEVQFNPETLNIAFSNQVAGGDQAGGSAIQFNSKGTTKLTFDLVFDVTDPKIEQRFNKDNKPESRTDVRKITKLVADFMQTEQEGSGDDARFVPPGVRFKWGTFRFDGVVDKITEKIDFFSEEGVPLRSTLSVGITKQDVDVNFLSPDTDAQGNPAPGTSQKPTAKENSSMADALAQTGNPEQWQGDALANGIENPRDLPLGQPLDLGSDLATGINAGLQASAGAGAGFGASTGLGGGISGSLGGSFGVGISAGASLEGGIGGGIGGGISGGISSGIGGEISGGIGGGVSAGVGGGTGIEISGGTDFEIDASAELALNGSVSASASADFEF